MKFEDKQTHKAAKKTTKTLKSPEPVKSPKPKNLGRKLLKTTTKFFSPNKKKDLSRAQNSKKCPKKVSNEPAGFVNPANNKIHYSQNRSDQDNQSETKNDKKENLIRAMLASHIKRAEEKKKVQMALGIHKYNSSEKDKGSTESSSSVSCSVSHVSKPIAHGVSVLKSEPLATPSIKKISRSSCSPQDNLYPIRSSDLTISIKRHVNPLFSAVQRLRGVRCLQVV